jgi:hypothetical protein
MTKTVGGVSGILLLTIRKDQKGILRKNISAMIPWTGPEME